MGLSGFVTAAPNGVLGPRCSPMGRGATYGPTGLLGLGSQGRGRPPPLGAQRAPAAARPSRRQRHRWQPVLALGCAGTGCHLAAEARFLACIHGSKASSPVRWRSEQRPAFARAAVGRPKGSPASAQSVEVRSGLTRRAHTRERRSRLEGRFPEVAANMHGTTLGAGALGFANGEVVAKARWGAAGQNSRAHSPAEKGSRREGRYTATRSTSPRRHAKMRRGEDKSLVHWGAHHRVTLHRKNTALRRAPTRGGRRGLDRGAGVRGHRHRDLLPAQTNSSQRPTPGHKARHAHGARHGGASRGTPWSSQRNSNAATR
jgi:hypothetical protein